MFGFGYAAKFIEKHFGPDIATDFDHPVKNLDSKSPFYNECTSAISMIDNHDRQNITITSFDGVRLTARYFSSNSKKTVILLHDVFKDPIAEFCLIINYYLTIGCNVLVPYQRGHYLSKAKYHSFGYLESQDLKLWVSNMVSTNGPDCEIYIEGVGIGANAICMMLGLDFPKKNIKALLLDSPFLGLKDYITALVEKDNVKDLDGTKFDIYKLIEKNLGFNVSKSSCITPIKKCDIPCYFACKERTGDRSSVDTQTLATFCPKTMETLVLPCDEFDADETYFVNRVQYNNLIKKFINVTK